MLWAEETFQNIAFLAAGAGQRFVRQREEGDEAGT